MNWFWIVVSFLTMLVGVAITARISVGVSVTILGAAVYIGASVHLAVEDLLRERAKAKPN